MKLSPSVRLELMRTARAAIDRSLLSGSPTGVSVRRTEPGLVAAVTTYAVPQLATDWRQILQPTGTNIAISAVFTHQAPKVRFISFRKPTAICELADLLLVVDNIRTGKRHAALIQAKMAAQRGTVIISRPQDKLQLELFQNWPRFNFLEPIYKLTNVDFHSGGFANDCGQYGVIDRHCVSPPVWSQMLPSTVPGKTLAAPVLAKFIVDLVQGRVGRDATPALENDWSRTVEALMTVTYGRPFHHRQSLGQLAFPRGNTTQAFFLQGNLIQMSVTTDGSLPADAEPRLELIDVEPPNRALSTIWIELSND
ncbi:hypothetical protein [Phyllobacterium endophyticum]|uniref:hypothetical protein n=1 Tax=Phyllobacterium endophyticum TaxID=1149773 RepID=UPI0011C88E7D|nr:hypothetical protein [Phyllobacterium endophyticum]TXR49457.1 hypothetical protein FVA77_09010 [Phyllobacterium endophyticum]